MDKLSKAGDLSDDQKARLAKVQDFAKRFDEGAPADNISGKEAAVAYRGVANRLTPDQLKEASEEVFAGMSAEDRQKVSQIMKEAGGEQFADLDDDPTHLANATVQIRGSQQASGGGGLVDSLLGQGGGASGLLDNPMVKTVLAGIASVGMQKFMGGGSGGGLRGLLGGLLGGGGSGGQGGSSRGGGLDDMLSGLLGGGGGGGSQGGGLDDLLGGLLGGEQGGGEKPSSKRNVL